MEIKDYGGFSPARMLLIAFSKKTTHSTALGIFWRKGKLPKKIEVIIWNWIIFNECLNDKIQTRHPNWCILYKGHVETGNHISLGCPYTLLETPPNLQIVF